VLLVPLSVLGGRFFGLEGVFAGRMVADVVSGALGVVWSGIVLRSVARASMVTGPGHGAESSLADARDGR
jgi:hypothetical protein